MATKKNPRPAKKNTAAKSKPATKKAAKATTKTATKTKPATKTPTKSAKSATKTARASRPSRPSRPRDVSTKSNNAVNASQRIDEKIASLSDWRGQLLGEIRRLIHDVDPEVVEEWKWMGTPVWSHDGMFANANPFKDKVKVTFHHGAQLEDPNKIFNNGLSGNKWRAIDLYEGDSLDHAAFKALLREAIAYNTSHNVPKSKGSRASLLKDTKP